MNTSLPSMIGAAVLASFGLCAGALAQDKAPPAAANPDKTQVVPGKKDLKPFPATVEKMDENTQRIHDRDRAAKPQGGASGSRATADAGQQQTRKPPEGVRDWAAIDKNKDNLISPEEMEAALQEGRPAAASASAPK